MKIAGERSRFAGKMGLPKKGWRASRADWNRWFTKTTSATRKANVTDRKDSRCSRHERLGPLHFPNRYDDMFRSRA